MAEPKIAREVAEENVRKWAELLGHDLKGVLPDSVVLAVMDGRASFDEAAESFSYTLIKPVSLENGETVRTVALQEPTVLQLADASKATRDEMVILQRLLSYVTGLAVGVVQRMKQRDLIVVGELLGFFS